jgi:hypothetical protein
MLAPSSQYVLRPQTSGAIVCHQPFTLDPERLIPPSILGPVPAVPALPQTEVRRERRPTLTKASEAANQAPAAWPLPDTTVVDIKVAVTNHDSKKSGGEAALEDVSEEDEDAEKERRRRSRASIRASRSVPMLRKIVQLQQESEMRPPSGASETLGRNDLLAAQRALKSALLQSHAGEPLFMDDENWEDDIDYCYEHDANADFDYEWNRPSIDLSRSFNNCIPVHEIDRTISYLGTPKLNTDVPALSPASQLSGNDSSEAATPTGPTSTSLDLPRVGMVQALGIQNRFTVDQFEFSHERHVNDFMAKAEPHKMRSRSSTVTTVAYTDDDSRSVFDAADKHASISSNQTSLTRYTCSTGSLKRQASWKKQLAGASPLPSSTDLAGTCQDRPATPLRSHTPTGHLSPEPACSPWMASGTPGRKSGEHRSPGHVSRASDSTPMIMDQANLREQVARQRRPRARTTTGSAPGTPAPAQYGLFPRTSPKNRA